MQTRLYAGMAGALAVLFFFASPALAYECEEEPKAFKQHAFFFDRNDFYLAQKDANPVMDKVESHEGRVQLKTFDAPSVLTGPSGWASELFNAPALCNWWPQDLALPIGAAYQSFMGKLTVGGSYGAAFNVHDYNATVALRWYLWDDDLVRTAGFFGLPYLSVQNSVAFLAIEDNHWSWHPGQAVIVRGQEVGVEEYAEINGIDTSRVFVTDVFSVQWAHYFRPHSKLPVEYRVGYNMFQGALSDFFNERKHRDYPYQWFLEGQFAYEPTAYVSFPFTALVETNGREVLQQYEIAIETRLSKRSERSVGGWKFFLKLPNGIADTAAASTRWGLWSSSPMIGFGWSGAPGGF